MAGSLNADVVVAVDRLPAPGETVLAQDLHWHAGGKGANQAAAAALAGAPTTLIGCVGDDEDADRLRRVLTELGVQLGLRTVPGPTGRALISVDAAGENSIVVVGGANDLLDPSDVTGLGLTARDVAVAVLESPAPAIEAFLSDAGPARRILSPTPVEACSRALLAVADLVVVNEHEYAALAPIDAEVIVTLGSKGVRVGDEHFPAPAVETVDSTGAGDCFVGTLAAHLAAGCDLVEAATRANDAAARSVTRRGAMESYR